MSLNEKNIFLVDGLGAVMSAIFTGLVLPQFSEFIGLQKNILLILCAFPIFYGLYSLSCYFFVQKIKPWMLIIIIVLNIVYCMVSFQFMMTSPTITPWGKALIIGEIFIILGVVAIETYVLRKTLLKKFG